MLLLSRVAVCCSVLRCVAACCGVLQCVAACCGVLQCVAACCGVLQCVAYIKCVGAVENFSAHCISMCHVAYVKESCLLNVHT